MENFYRNVLGFHDDALVAQLCAVSSVETFKKGQQILGLGELPKKMYFLMEGGVRCYFLDEDGQDVTDYFMFEVGEPVMVLEYEKPACCGMVAYKETTLLSVPIEEGTRAIRANAEAQALYAEMMRFSVRRHWELKQHMHDTAAQRYEWFREAYAPVADEVSDRCIASFLGLSPVSLSRVRHSRETKGQKENEKNK